MKSKLLFCALLSSMHFTYVGYSQNPVSREAFSKMMVDYYNFALVGSQTPTTGFKVETNKPSITLKGNIFSDKNRRFVTNLELEGGLNSGLMQLVSGKDVNSYFKGSIGCNILRSNNIGSHYVLTATEYRMTNNAFNNNKVLLAKQLDTFIIIKTITDDGNFLQYGFNTFKSAVIAESNLPKYQLNNFTRQYSVTRDTYYVSLIRNVLIYYGATADNNSDTLFDNFKRSIANPNNSTVQTKKILEDYDRIKESLLKETYTLNDKQNDFEISLTKVNWTWKIIGWWNFSLAATNSNFKLYSPSSQTLLDSNSFLPSLSISYNWLFKGKKVSNFAYLRIGGSVQKTNSLDDLQKFDYKKETIITASPNEELKSSKEGTAYEGSLIEKGGLDLFFESYWVPWEQQFIPGFHLKTVYRNSKAWINENKIALDLGLIWNVPNSDKDAKNILTIVPYVSWSNLLKEYKDDARTKEKSLSDLFSFNVRFGIPINLGK